jgi:hypothetical protein
MMEKKIIELIYEHANQSDRNSAGDCAMHYMNLLPLERDAQ